MNRSDAQIRHSLALLSVHASLLIRATARDRELRAVVERSRDLVWLVRAQRGGRAPTGPPIRGSSDPCRSICIVVVDDRPDSRYLTVHALTTASAHYDVRESATGRDALRLAHIVPDLIILDVKLPDIDGIEVCRRLKADPVTGAIPVLLKTAFYQDDGHRAAGLAAGANGYLCDPTERATLLEAVERLLARYA